MICLAIRTDPVSKPVSGDNTSFRGWVLTRGKWTGLLSNNRFDNSRMRTGSTTAGAIVQWLRTCCSTPG
jgi:hypothetical protein